MESRDGIRTWNLSLFLLPYEGNNNLRTKMNNKKTAKKIMKKPSTRTTIASATIIAIVASAAMILGVLQSQTSPSALAQSYGSNGTTADNNSKLYCIS